MRKFIPLKAHEVCAICGHKGWCAVSLDGSAILCARVMSEKKVGDKGAGWLHIAHEPVPKMVRKPVTEKPRPVIDWIEFNEGCMAAMPDNDCLYEELGVSAESLGRMEIGWSVLKAAYTFPMRDGDGKIIGIRTRYRTGAKKSIYGSQNGIFIPRGKPEKELWICEGPTDCAALLTLGYFAIGRPSNVGGMQFILDYCGRNKIVRELVIMADRDASDVAEALTLHAAGELVQRLSGIGRRAKVIRPQLGVKDIRQWVGLGATRAMIDCILRDAL